MDRAAKNYRIGLTHESLWGFAFGLIQPMTILPLALTDLGGTASQAGFLAGVIGLGINLPQAFSALAFSPRWTDPKRLALLHVPAVLSSFFTAGVFFAHPADPALHRTLFLVGCAAFFLSVGVTVPHWMVATTRCVDEKVRGRYFGLSFFLSGLLGAGTSRLSAVWAASAGLEWGYGTSFLLAGCFQTLSILVLTLWNPARKAPEPRRGPLVPFLRSLFPPPERRAWGLFLLFSALVILVNAPSGLFTVDLRDAHQAPKALFALLAPAFAFGAMGGSFLMGWWSDHYGSRGALAGGVLAGMAALGLVAFAPAGVVQALSFFGSGYANNIFIANMVVLLALSGKDHPVIKIGLYSTVLAPVQFLAPRWAGALAESSGYGAAYALAALMGLGALSLLAPNPLWRFLRSRK